MSSPRGPAFTASVFACVALAACGGGFHASSTPSSGGTSPVSVQVSGTSTLSSTCGITVPTGSNETYTLGSGIQPQIAAVPQGAVVGVWEQDRWTGYGARAVMGARSTDSGATWSTPIVLPFSNCGGGSAVGSTYDRASDPWIAFAGSGTVVASALAFSANGFTAGGGFSTTGGPSAVLVSRSTDGGSTWSSPAVPVWSDANSGAGPFFFNDRDSVAADASGNVYVVWDRISSTGGSTPAYLGWSKDGGVSFTSGILYDPLGTNEAFNNEIVILTNGTVLDFFTLLPASGSPSLQLVSLSFSGTGWTASAPVTAVPAMTSVGTPNPIASGKTIRDSSLLAQVAVDSTSGGSGNVAAVWQQSFNSSTFDGIALSVSTNSGSTWSTPVQVNGMTSVAAFSPTVRYLPGGVLAVTYYDLRNYASGSSVLSTSAWLTESNDGGKTWHELQLQSAFDLNNAPLADDTKLGFGSTALFLGDNQGLALVAGNPLPFYAATTSAGARIVATYGANPLTSSTAHTYTAAALGRPSAVAVARATANAERMRRRGLASGGPQ